MPRWSSPRALVPAALLLVALSAGCDAPPASPSPPAAARAVEPDGQRSWSARELETIRSLSLARLGPPPASPGNAVADDPQARSLGARLFHDVRLSARGDVACMTCHQAALHFSDGLPAPLALDGRKRHTPTLNGVAWSRWQFWDGRADSLWAQAVQPLFDDLEHSLSPARLQTLIRRHYADDYRQVFGRDADGDPLRVAADVGKALEAFQRQLRPLPSRFDRYVAGLAQDPQPAAPALDAREQAGLALFMGRGQCLRCHFGPLFTSQGFANTGLASHLDGRADGGRAEGIVKAARDSFNCAGAYSDAPPEACGHLRHLRPNAPEWLGAFKVPTLRGVAFSAPYMHDGRFATLEAVVDHYRHAPNQDGDYGHSELFPLRLSDDEAAALTAFLKTL